MLFDIDDDWKADLARVGANASVFQEQSLWAIWVYRFGRRILKHPDGFKKRVYDRLYWLLFRLVETSIGISIPRECNIGAGLRIWHFGGIFIHPNATIGINCTLRQGVTVGNSGLSSEAPSIGSNVDLGAYSQVIGQITLGDNVVVGALTAVVKNVPPNQIVVGQPSRVIGRKF